MAVREDLLRATDSFFFFIRRRTTTKVYLTAADDWTSYYELLGLGGYSVRASERVNSHNSSQ